MHEQPPPLWKLPGQCVLCHAWPAQSICHMCRQAYAQTQPRCAGCALLLPAGHAAHRHHAGPENADTGLEQATSNTNTNTQPAPTQHGSSSHSHPCTDYLCAHCLHQPFAGIDGSHAAVSYTWPWQQCVDAFKFGAQTGWAFTFAELMLQDPQTLQTVCACDWLIPMPLHRRRLAERGFNQYLLLAKALRARAAQRQPLAPLKAQLSSNTLLRIRHTPAQSQLPLSARLRNVHKAFAVASSKAAALAGTSVALVDDVMTSGASAQAAARALRHAGVAQLHVLVFARTEKNPA